MENTSTNHPSPTISGKHETVAWTELTEIRKSYFQSLSLDFKLFYGSAIIVLVVLDILMCIETLSEISLTIYDSILPDQRYHADLMQLDLRQSIKLFWDGNAYLLSIGLVVTVIIIPLAIFALTMVIFFVPITWKRRNDLFHILLWSAKWQLMNGILPVYIFCALVINFHELDVFVEVNATPTSIGNLCIWAPNMLITFILISHFHHSLPYAHNAPRAFVYMLQVLLMTFSCFLIYLVYTEKIIKFELSGLTTIILPEDLKLRDASIIDLYHLIPDLFPTNMGILWNIICAPIGAFGISMLNCLTQSRYPLFTSLHKIFSAYGAVEVLLGVNIAVALEMGELSTFLVDYKAKTFCEAQRKETNMPCLRSDGSIQPATWYLLAAFTCYGLHLALPSLYRWWHGTEEPQPLIHRNSTGYLEPSSYLSRSSAENSFFHALFNSMGKL